MKNMLLILFALTSISSIAGINLECNRSPLDEYRETKESATIIVYDYLRLYCHEKDNEQNRYIMDFEGWGAGASLKAGKDISFKCPWIPKELTESKYYGLRVSATALVGFDLAMFTHGNYHAAGNPASTNPCFMIGLSIGNIGASVTAGTLQIMRDRD